VTLDPMRRPAGGQIRLVLGEDHVRVAHAAVVGHGADAGQRTADVSAAEGAARGRCWRRRTLRIRAQAAEAGVEPDLRADRPVDDRRREGAARGGLAAARCPEAGSRNASTAATSTGKYSGRPPAIASAIAQDSIVVTPPRGGKMPSVAPRGCAAPRRIQSTRSRVGGQSGRPSPQRLASMR
jgi:hypothetical protein